MSHITAVLDGEKTRLETLRDSVASPPSLYQKAIYNRSLDVIARMRQGATESLVDYQLRVNQMAQQAPAGDWAASFWAQVESAVQAEHGESIKGGLGRSTT